MSFLKRHFFPIFLSTVLSGLLFIYVATQKTAPSYHTILFTTIANQSESSSQENEQASTYFGETLMGWFRNPSFLNKIFETAGIQGAISAHKQERQNLIIEIDSANQADGEKLAQKTLTALEAEIVTFNQKTQSNFQILNLGITTSPNPIKNTFLLFAGFLFGFLMISGLILIFEALQGKISFLSQIKTFFPEINILSLASKNENDLNYLASLYLKQNNPIVLAGVDFDNSTTTVKTSLIASEIEPNIILIDGALNQKKLHTELGLSEMMKNLKGITDRLKKEEQLAQFIQINFKQNLDFLAAGSGKNIILEDLSSELSSHKTILIHTQLPENFPILTFPDFTLILFVKLGITKLKTLELIQNLKIQNLKIIVLN